MTTPAFFFAIACWFFLLRPEPHMLEFFVALAIYGLAVGGDIIYRAWTIRFRSPLDIVNDEMKRQRERRQR